MTTEELRAAEAAKRQPVRAIFGPEPPRENEYPTVYMVGSGCSVGPGLVERIAYREDNYGDHGLGWFDIIIDGRRVASVAARAVAEIHYADEPAPPPKTDDDDDIPF